MSATAQDRRAPNVALVSEDDEPSLLELWLVQLSMECSTLSIPSLSSAGRVRNYAETYMVAWSLVRGGR
jgi:hypothetical protein